MLRYFEAFLDYVRQQGIYIYRGDPAGYDFNLAAFTRDGNWHELDLSGIVPANAKAVDVSVQVFCLDAGGHFYFRRAGQTNTINKTRSITQDANASYFVDLTIPVDTDRKIEYQIEAVAWASFSFTVKGWWY